MYILYLDESGTHDSRHFVVGGLAVFERETYFLAQSLDQLQARYLPDVSVPAQFHASELRYSSPPPPFNALSYEQRYALLSDVYGVISDSHARLFAVAMEKAETDGDPYERGFEEIVYMFDLMLRRLLRERDEKQRGLIVIAESNYKNNLNLLAGKIAREGHRLGRIYNLADIPYFAPAKSTRLLQLADFVVNAVYGYYESGYATQFNRIAHKMDHEPGRMHGLVHIARDRQTCPCPACVTRRAAPRADRDWPN